MADEPKKISLSEFIALLEDDETTAEALQPYLVAAPGSGPFYPKFFPNPDLVDDEQLESAISIGNGWSRRRRRRKFNKRRRRGDRSPVLVSEGDSWFQFPLLIDDVIDALEDDYLIWSLGGAGDTAKGIIFEQREYMAALDEQADDVQAFLFSAAGNDIIGEDDDGQPVLLDLLHAQTTSRRSAEQLINKAAVGRVIDRLRKAYSTVIRTVRKDTRFKTLPIIVHGYDYALPYPAGSRDPRRPIYAKRDEWLGSAFEAKGISNTSVRQEIIRILVNDLYDMLFGLMEKHKHVHVVDVRKTLPDVSDWADEIHPTSAGFKHVAAHFRKVIEPLVDRERQVVEAVSVQTASAQLMSHDDQYAGDETQDISLNDETYFDHENMESAMKVVVLDPGHGGSRKIGGSSWNNARGPNGLLEKTVTLDIARRTQHILEQSGFDVHLTRDSDVNLGLKARALVAKRQRAHAFVSIHFNGFDNHVQGTETFVHRRHTSNSAKLGRVVQASVLTATGYRDRNRGQPGGVKRAGFAVLSPDAHRSTTACVLLEVSFMDVPAEERRLRTDAYKDRIAEAIAAGISDYFGINEGVAPAGAAAALDMLGDAIELEAAGLGIPVMEYLGGEEADDEYDDEYVEPTGEDVLDEEEDYVGSWNETYENEMSFDLEQLVPEQEEGEDDGALVAEPRAILKYSNQSAIRNRKCTKNIERKLVEAVTTVYGPGYTVSIYSGGQDRKGRGSRRTGSIRHDDFGRGGRAADVYVYDENGRKVTGLRLAELGQYWLAKRYGGVGHEMRVGGIHLDEWTTPPRGGGMFWTYAYSRNQSWGAEARRMLARGARGDLP